MPLYPPGLRYFWIVIETGTGAWYVYPPAKRPAWPDTVTITSAVPPEPAPVVAVIEVVETTWTPVAATPPIVTVAPAAKFAPVIVTFVPPRIETGLA